MADSMISNQQLTLKTLIPTTHWVWDTFTIFETWVVTDNSSIVFKNKLQLERMVVDIATDGTCTIVLRGLDNSETKTEVAGNMKEWSTGALWYITMLASDLLDVDKDGWITTISANMQYTWEVEQTWVETISWELDVTGKSKPRPRVADDTARDVKYPSPEDWDVCFVGWDIQKYNGSTAQWETLDVWTPTPNASESQAGKAKVATDAEFLAWTDETLWVYNIPKVSDVKGMVEDKNGFVIKEYMAGETITPWQYTFLESIPSYSSAIEETAICKNNDSKRIQLPIVWAWIAWDTLYLALKKTWTPTQDLWIRIETDTDGSPSWTLADVNAISNIWQIALSTSKGQIEITLSWSITLDKWVKYHIVLFNWTYWTETVDGSNYYTVFNATKSSLREWEVYDSFYETRWASVPYSMVNWASTTYYDVTQDTQTQWICFSEDWTKMYVAWAQNNEIFQYTLSTPRIVTTASYDNKSLDVSWQTTTNYSVAISSDWTKMYVWYWASPTYLLYQYTLTTPFDVSTGSYSGKSYDSSAEHPYTKSIRFKTDGTKMYKNGWSALFQYTLSTARDISTASYDSKSFSFGLQDSGMRWFDISWDWRVMMAMWYVNDEAYKYTLSTPHDISTASYTWDSFSIWGSQTEDCFMSTDWKYLYNMDNYDYVYRYSLEYSIWTISTYVESDLVQDPVLALTDASYPYKTAREWVSKDTVAIWWYPELIVEWLDENQSWMTIWDDMYLSTTPWAISSVLTATSIGSALTSTILKIATSNRLKHYVGFPVGTIRQALTDWFVVANLGVTWSWSATISIVSDSGATPSFVLAKSWCDTSSYFSSCTAPIKKWDYYQVVVANKAWTPTKTSNARFVQLS